ncbi:ArsR family transcriptional regulator [Deinococcus cavernae]|uniref:ArsR family transcriptional regulator n=1 Tax=Deinococcus cavernae TaxID=2320857 RepID=A0A418V997_9DEIO|nr:winged helix-turn-helix domain-containing protein [Deinococcus cavernae]RJF72622.1 ArsR family transcriptional regulator [Deinococcus cavernae]
MEKQVDTRLQALEERVTALEQQLTSAPTVREKQLADFWILHGLQERQIDGVTFAGNVTLPDQGEVQWQFGLSTPTLLGQEWEAAAPVFAALGHPARLQLLKAVLEGQTRNAELSQLEDLGSTGQLYHHLRELVAAGWLKTAGRGAHRVPAERLVPLLIMLTASEALMPNAGDDHE